MSTLIKKTLIAALALADTTTAAYAQSSYPAKPVRIIVTEPGGSSDVYARIIAQGLTNSWGRQVIVDNRPAIIAIETAIQAQPDGYSLLCYASSFWIGPVLQRGTYDPIKDVTPITIALRAPNVLAVNSSVPVKSVKELIELAKAQPGKLNYGSGGNGSGGHLAGELFNSMAGVKIVRIPYKGAGPATSAAVSGEVQMIFATIGSVGQHIKSGRLRGLGVTSAKPSPLVPDLPAISSVLPGYDSTLIQGFFAPAKTPPAIIKKIQQDIAAVLAQPDVKEKFLVLGTETIGSTPEELSKAMKSEIAQLGKLFKAGGIKLD